MHLPEAALRPSRFGRLRREQCVGVSFREREVSEDETELAFQLALYGLYDGMRPAAMWAFVVTVLDEGDRRIVRTSHVIELAHWWGQSTISSHGRASMPGRNSALPGAD